MRYTDDEVMNLTPRMLASQLAVHKDVRQRMYGVSPQEGDNEPVSCIDQIPGW